MFGGDLPWLKGLLGLSTHPSVMSPWNRGVWQRPKKDKDGVEQPGFYTGLEGNTFAERTAETDAAALARANAEPQVLLRDGVKRDPVLPFQCREDVVFCILHCTMAIGRLAGLYIMHLCSEATDAQKALVRAELRRNHLRIPVYARGKDLLKAPSLKGHHVGDLFKVWRTSIAATLGVDRSDGDDAMRNMEWVLRTLYRSTYNENPAQEIAQKVAAFRDYCVVESGVGELGNYLFVLQHDAPRLVTHLYENRGKYGLGMFSQDIAESINRLLKDAFVSYTNRGGGLGGHIEALRQAWSRVFLYFHVPLLLTGQTRKHQCQNRDAFRGDGSDDEARGRVDAVQ